MRARREGCHDARVLDLLSPELRVTRNGRELILQSTHPLGPLERCAGDWLVRWARERPDATFLAEREASGGAWRTVSYGRALERVERLASALLARGAAASRPVMIASDNSVASALLALAAMHLGVPVAPVSPAYSLQSRSFARLRAVAAQLSPGFLFVEEEAPFAAALAALRDSFAETSPPILLTARSLDELEREGSPQDAARAAAFAVVGPDTIAKVLVTSGSTGWP